jgi:Ribonuclease G/E
MHINPKDNSLRYKILPNYSDRAIGFLKTTKHSLLNAANAIIEKKYYDNYTKECVEILIQNELITQEMVEYMKEVMPENTKFSLEYLMDSENNLTDIILHNTVIEKFIDISEEQRITRETERRPYTI